MKVGGSSSHGRHSAPPLAEINIVPLVDVTLVILIIFMVTMTFDKAKPEKPRDPVFKLPIVLPQSNVATDKADDAPTLVLGVDKFGQKYVGTQPASTEALREKVREAAKNPLTHIRIDADRESKYLDIIELIELCQLEGLRNVGLHTANKDGS